MSDRVRPMITLGSAKTKAVAVGFAAACALAIAGCSSSSTPSPSASVSSDPENASWSYSGATGPENWGSLSPAYAQCSEGKLQSPIDITGAATGTAPAPKPNWKSGESVAVNTGHSVNFYPQTDSTLTFGGDKYYLTQMHFHAPGENSIDGTNYPLEFHFVNQTQDGKVIAIGLFATPGAENPAWNPMLEALAVQPNGLDGDQTVVNWADLLPAKYQAYNFDGSLTTPGCAEGLNWFQISKPITLSAAQIAAFTAAYDDNNRPIQPLNARPITLTPSN